MLLRFAMILQSQAPSTLNKYICKLAEAVLIEYNTGLSLYSLGQIINSQFNLAFTEEEIDTAILKKAQAVFWSLMGYILCLRLLFNRFPHNLRLQTN